MTTRRVFLGALTAGLVTPPAAHAQGPRKIWRVGILWTTSPPLVASARAGLLAALRDLGYVEGRNVAFEDRYAEDRPERLPKLVAEFLRLPVDVIVTQGTPAAQAAKEATRSIPVVMTLVANPVGIGLVASLAHPGGNVTGLTNIGGELSAKRLELLKDALPKLSRVAVLWDSSGPADADRYGRLATERSAQTLGLTLQLVSIQRTEELPRAFEAASHGRAEALLVLPSPILAWNIKPLVELAAKHRLPTIYQWRAFAEVGGLMSYGPSSVEQLARAAVYVDKILKGAKPADLPVEQPTKFELVINLKTAKALGLTIPPSLLQRADEVIQ
jgi:putative ABC transport system substrate-binding protein